MATTLDELQVRVVVDATGAIKGFKDASGKIRKLSDDAMDANTVFKQMGSQLKQLAAGVVVFNQALELAGKAQRALVEPIKKATAAYLGEVDAQYKLATAMKLGAGFTRQSFREMQAFAEELESTANVSKETSTNLLAIGLAAGKTDVQAKKLVSTAADLAAGLGKDVNETFNALLETMKGEAGELSKFAPALKGFTAEALKSGAGVEYLGKAFAGMAQEAAKFGTGPWAQVMLQLNNVIKEIGKTINDVFQLPAAAASLAQWLRELRKDIAGVRGSLIHVRDALAGVDWGELVTSLRNVALGFIAWKAALFTTELYLAIKAIGGLTAAMAAMGGMAGMMASLKAWFVGSHFVKGAKAMALFSVKFAAIATVILVAAAAVDVLIRNFDNLENLLEVVSQGALSLFKRFGRGLHAMRAAFMMAIIGMLEAVPTALLELGGIGEGALQAARESLKETGDTMEVLGEEADIAGDRFKKAAEKVDWGFAAQGLELVKRLLGDSADESGDLADSMAETAGNIQAAAAMSKDQLDAVRQLKEENDQIAQDIASTGLSQVQQIQLALAWDLKRIQAKRELLKLEGKWSEQAEEQLMLQEDLLKDRANVKTEAVKKPNFVSPDDLEAISGVFGEGASGFAGAVGGAMGMVTGGISAAMGVVNGMLDFVQQVIDFIPGVLDKLTNIVTSLTDLPNKITQGVKNLNNAVIQMIGKLIPNLLRSMIDTLDDLLMTTFQRIPQALEDLMASLPEVIMGIVDRLPEIIERIVTSFVSSGPKLAVAFIKFMLKDAHNIGMAIMRQTVIEVPKAIIRGIIEGLRNIRDLLAGIFKVDPKQLQDGVKQIQAAIGGASDDVFRVLDDAAEDRGLGLADKIGAAIDSATNRTKDVLTQLWEALKRLWDNFVRPILEGFVNAMMFLWDGLVRPILEGFATLMMTLWDTIVRPIFEAFSTALTYLFEQIIGPIFQGFIDAATNLWDMVVRPILEGFVTLMTELWNTIIKPIADALVSGLSASWKFVEEKLLPPFKAFADALGSFAKGVTDALSVDKLKGWGGKIADGLKEALDVQATIDKFKGVGGKIWDGLKNVLSADTFTNLGKNVWNGLKDSLDAQKFIDRGINIWNGLKDKLTEGWSWLKDSFGSAFSDGLFQAVNGLWQWLNDFFSAVFGNAFGSIGGGGGGGLGIPGFAEGGPIPGYATQLRQDDTLIRAKAGEFMLNTTGRGVLGDELLHAANSGMSVGGGASTTNFNVTMTVNTTEKVDGDRLYREFTERLKRDSYEGKEILSGRGVRK